MTDLHIAGPGSPLSLQKILKEIDDKKPLHLLVDGTGLGIAKDDPDVFVISPDACYTQACYYSKEMFNGKQIPAYLYRYLWYMFKQPHETRGEPTYKTDQDLIDYMNTGELHTEHDDYMYICGLIKYCEHNKEAAQIIGLIQLFAGALRIAKKNDSVIKVYFEHPEYSLHPKRQSWVIDLILQLEKEYGYGFLSQQNRDEQS